jgi:Holliday junction DNA helicase RuvB
MLNRPQTFNEFIGMSKLKKVLKIIIASAIKQNKPIDHILLYGSAGLGKTSMAYLISKYSKQKIKYINGNLLEKKSDILSIFANIKEKDIIFIDEIHALSKQVEELLFSAIEDNVVDILVGTEGESKIVRFKLKSFTLIGATTEFGKITQPLLDRFGFSWKFDYYNDEDIKKILCQDAKNMNYIFEESALNFFNIFIIIVIKFP